MASTEYTEKRLAKRIADFGLAAFSAEFIPAGLYSGNVWAPCIKHPAGFLTLRNAVGSGDRHVADIEYWDRVILTIHDYRHEYLFYSAHNAAILRGTIEAYREILERRIGSAPRLKNRASVAYIPKMGLMTVEAKRFDGRPDLEALRMFVHAYLASESVEQDITDAFRKGGMEAARIGPKSRINEMLTPAAAAAVVAQPAPVTRRARSRAVEQVD